MEDVPAEGRPRDGSWSRRLPPRPEEFERVSSRDQRRSLENDIFMVSLDYVLLSTSQVSLLTDLFAGCNVSCPVLGLSAGRCEEGLDHH